MAMKTQHRQKLIFFFKEMFPKLIFFFKEMQVSNNDFQEAEVKFGINLLDFCMNSTVDTGHICSTHMELTTTEVYKK